jgi:hypothetical protein
MSRKEIESLLVWLIAALLFSTIAAPILIQYSKSLIDIGNTSVPLGLTKGEALSLTMYVTLFSKSLVNLVIASWIFKTATSKKTLWVVFGLLAGWWALPLFIFYHYFTDEAPIQPLHQASAE